MTGTTRGASWPDHLLDLTEWDALPEDASRRFELVEGVVVVAPRPSPRHQDLLHRLTAELRRTVPPGWTALPEVELVVDGHAPATVRVPDIAVVRAEVLDDRARLTADDVLAVVEVLSPGSHRTDRVAKVADYADAGIAHYLLVDPGPPPTLRELGLRDGAYVEVAHHRGRADLALGATITLA